MNSTYHGREIMGKYLVTAIAFILILSLSGSVMGRDLFGNTGNRIAEAGKLNYAAPYVDFRYHRVSGMGFSITNRGQLGLFGINADDPQNQGEQAHSLEYPIESGNQHLFGGALWIGAVVGDDTLVSVAADGWFQTQELWPEEYPEGSIIYRSTDNGDVGAVSNQDFIAVYTDTLTDPAYVMNDPIDGRPHVPLGIKITQKSYAWDHPSAEGIVIMDFEVENIGENVLDDVYIGFYVDGDVLNTDDVMNVTDDVAGFVDPITWGGAQCPIETNLGLGYIIDNDGLDQGGSCPYDADSPNDITGITVLRSPIDFLEMNFNWWISNSIASADFGPRQAGTAEDPFRDFGGNLGTPTGDRNKYYMMSHPERDYDQLYTAVDHSSEGWLSPPSDAADLANGCDTRYLLSFGPFRITPGEILPFTIAVVGAEDVHTDCNAFQDLYDPADPDAFYSTLDFNDISTKALYASWIYDNPGVDTDGDGDFGRYVTCCVDSEFVDGVWECTEYENIYYEGDGVPDFKPFFDTIDVEIDQPQLHWADANLVEPEQLTFSLADIASLFNPEDVDEATVQVNGIAAQEVTIIPTAGGMPPRLIVKVDKSEFVAGYGLVWDNEEHDFHVTGSQMNGYDFDVVGTVNIQGHVSGDFNLDGRQDMLDIIWLVDYKFRGGEAPQPIPDAGDVDGSGFVNVLDIIYYIDYRFNDGPALMHP